MLRNTLFFALLFSTIACASVSNPCDLRKTKYGSVCVCTPEYCDYFDEPMPENDNDFLLVSSTKAGLRFEPTKGKFNLFKKVFVLDYDQRLPISEEEASEAKATRASNTRHVRLHINREKQFQKIAGFGGSFTGAVAYILDQLPQNLQDHVYESFYSERGIGFNLMRISIGGCDFDLAPWAYNEEPENDPKLSNFTKLDPRDELRIAQIKRLIEVSKVQNLRVKGAAWSSPRWMKSNNKWSGRNHLKKEYYQTWADYHLKWLELMEANGLPIWAISTGNEPLNGVAFMFFVRFMSLGWTAKHQAIWLADHLGPTIRNSKFKDIVLFGSDDQRYSFPMWFHQMKSARANSIDFLDALAVHWYWDVIVEPSLIDVTYAKMPEKLLISTESCIGDKPWEKAVPLLGSWERGEKYARAFLQDLQHSFNGWIDWNIILDENGGPNYVDNTVDAPVIANMTNLVEVYKQPMFYSIGHFSKFIPEGSIRIEAESSNINIDQVAFLRPDGRIATVVFNSGYANVEVNLTDSLRGTIVIKMPPKSIHTLVHK